MILERIGILVGGGPAPGINAVIAAATIEASHRGCQVVGINDGFAWLSQRYTDEQRELTPADVARIHLDGGTILGTSRVDVSRDPQALENALAALAKLRVEGLIVIGGDDQLGSAAAVSEASGGAVRVVLVPKTIDNDVWLPPGIPALGYETARHVAVRLVRNIMEDARTTGRWYLCVTMGRPTGNLTLGIGKVASATVTIIPEEFGTEPIGLDDVVDILEGSILKRRAMGRDFGVALLAESLPERMRAEDVAELRAAGRDEQGNIRVTEIALGRMVRKAVQARLERRGVKVTLVDKTIGYELRCAPPIPFDVEFGRDLGYAAVNYLLDGGTSSIVSIKGAEFHPIPFADALDPLTGRGRVRYVDVAVEGYKVAREYMVRLTAADLDDVEFVERLAEVAGSTPEEFREYFAPRCAAWGSRFDV